MSRRDDAPRDLLFGLLALQNGMVTRDQLVAAFAVWSAAGDRSMADLLAEHGALTTSRRTLLEALAAEHLSAHGGDPEQSLAALEVGRSTRESLARAGGPDVEATLGHVGAGSTRREGDPDPDRTATYAVGTATGDGLRFRVLRPHARGGLGAVFVALDAELNREVALKQLLDRHADDPSSRGRFLLEAEITGGLEHPGIVPVYGLGAYADGRPYYAMRFIRGDSLKEAIERFHADPGLNADPGRRALELRRLLRRFLDVCNAIEYAHSRGVLHRDVKPGNVIVGKHGETLVVDWGLAKPLGRVEPGAGAGERPLTPTSASGSAETLPGSALGTPAYMSPEQAAGDLDRLGPRSDVYSLGATLYCLLAGRPPLAGDDVGAVLRSVQRGEFPPPGQVKRGVPRALEAVCLKAMALRPEDRYATPRGLADDVETWLADGPVSAHRESPRERLARWSRRHRTLTGTAAATLVVAALAATALAVSVSRSRDQIRAQRNLARVQRDLAQKNFERAEASYALARKAVDRYLNRVTREELLRAQDRSDLRALRKRLLEDGLTFYKEFLRQRGDEPGLLAEPEETYARIAHIAGEIGSRTDELEARRKALEIAERLARDKPDNFRLRNNVAADLLNAAVTEGRVGNLAGAIDGYRRARDVFRALEKVARTPREKLTVRNNIAGVTLEIGNSQDETGDPEGALASYRASLAAYEALVRDYPDDPKLRGNLAIVVNNTGLLLKRLGRYGEAAAMFRRAAGQYHELTRLEPSEPRNRSEEAASYNDLGELRGARGNPVGGLRELERALALHRGVVRDHPSVLSYREYLARTLYNIATIRAGLGEADAARAGYRESLGLRRELAQANPAAPYYQMDVAKTLARLSELDRAADPPAAVRAAREALAIARRQVEVEPANQTIKADLADVWGDLGLALDAAGDGPGALAALDESAALFGALHARSPQLAPVRAGLWESLRRRASVLLRAGRVADSIDSARAAARLFPDDAARQFELARDLARCVPWSAPAAAAAAAALRDAVALGLDPSGDDARLLALDLALPPDPFAR